MAVWQLPQGVEREVLENMGLQVLGESDKSYDVNSPRGWKRHISEDGSLYVRNSKGIIQLETNNGGPLQAPKPYNIVNVDALATNPDFHTAYNSFQADISDLTEPVDISREVAKAVNRKVYGDICHELSFQLEADYGKLLGQYLRGVGGAIRKGKIDPTPEDFISQVLDYNSPRINDSNKNLLPEMHEIIGQELPGFLDFFRTGGFAYNTTMQDLGNAKLETDLTLFGQFYLKDKPGVSHIDSQDFTIEILPGSGRKQKSTMNHVNKKLYENLGSMISYR